MADSWRPVPARVLESAFRGALDIDSADGLRPLRIPRDLLREAPDPLALMATFTPGVRLAVRTAAGRLRLRAEFTRLVMAHLDHAVSRAEVLAEIDGEVVARATADPTTLVVEDKDGPWRQGDPVVSTLHLDLGDAAAARDVVLWLPADAGVRILSLEATAEVTASPAPASPRWLHHGSSISHGGDAADARGTWPAQAAHLLGVEGTNLGLAGNAILDQVTARAIARRPADVITLKLGINVVTSDAMRMRAFVPALHGFLDVVRDGHPHTPIVLITAISCPALESSTGPLRALPGGIAGTPRESPESRGALTLADTRTAIEAVALARADDPALQVMDGRDLLGPADVERLRDGLHPDQAGYDLMATRFATLAADPATPLGRAFSRPAAP